MQSLYRTVVSIPLLLGALDLKLDGPVGPMGSQAYTSLTALLLVAWTCALRGVEADNKQDIEQHLEMGKKLLAAGQLADALSHYHAAVEGDPSNYLTYFRRATVYLAIGKSKSALPDLDKVIELKPDFNAARLQRGNIKLKQGNLEEAKADFDEVLRRDPNNGDARTHADEIGPVFATRNTVRRLVGDGSYTDAEPMLTKLIEICPWDPELRELRAECYMEMGEYFKAINDIKPTTKLRPDNTAAYYRLSQLYYSLGDADEALNDVRECLKLDPDHKECYPHYKKVKKLVKQMTSAQNYINNGQWGDCVSKADQMLKTESRIHPYIMKAKSHKCHCFSKSGQTKQALDACGEVLDLDENNIEALCDRAEAYIMNDMFDEAVSDYQKAQGIDGNLQKIQEGLNRAQKLLKQSKKRDYYKILGVRRNANKREILKAYRKLAVKWHPDKYSGDDRKNAEKHFLDIAAAKEVLTDPEKRQKFDNGEDPLDPEQQQGGNGFNPFAQGFNPFGNDGFQFKFHFN